MFIHPQGRLYIVTDIPPQIFSLQGVNEQSTVEDSQHLYLTAASVTKDIAVLRRQ